MPTTADTVRCIRCPWSATEGRDSSHDHHHDRGSTCGAVAARRGERAMGRRLLGRASRAHPRGDRARACGTRCATRRSARGCATSASPPGSSEGVHTGPPFMDGDLYKWLEAAIAELEIDARSRARRDVEAVAALIASVQRDDGYLHTPTLIADAQPASTPSPSPTASTSRPTTSGTSSRPASATTRSPAARRCSMSRAARRRVPREPRDEQARSSSPAARSARRTTWP